MGAEAVLSDWSAYFEEAWRLRAGVLRTILANEHSLPRALRALDDFNDRNQMVATGRDFAFVPTRVEEDPLLRVEGRTEHVCLGQVVRHSRYHTVDRGALIADFARHKDCLFDVGGGYGRALLECWMAGGPGAARYINAEPTQSGRDMAALLAPLAAGMDLVSVPFRLEAPDFSALAGYSRILVVSALSIYCSWGFSCDFFRRLTVLDADVDCLFIEPVGHQLGGEDPLSRAQRDNALDKRLNTSFFASVNQAVQAGLVEVQSLVPNFDGRLDEPNSQISLFMLRVLREPSAPADASAGLLR